MLAFVILLVLVIIVPIILTRITYVSKSKVVLEDPQSEESKTGLQLPQPNQSGRRESAKGNVFVIMTFLLFLFLSITLPFHYLIDEPKVLLKTSLSFDYTFVSDSDIDELINKSNNGSFFDRQAIHNESIFKKLVDAGMIINNEDEVKNDPIIPFE